MVKQRLDSRGQESESDARWPQYLNTKKSFEALSAPENSLYTDTSSTEAGDTLQKSLGVIPS